MQGSFWQVLPGQKYVLILCSQYLTLQTA